MCRGHFQRKDVQNCAHQTIQRQSHRPTWTKRLIKYVPWIERRFAQFQIFFLSILDFRLVESRSKYGQKLSRWCSRRWGNYGSNQQTKSKRFLIGKYIFLSKKEFSRWFSLICDIFHFRLWYVNWKAKNRNSMNWLFCPRHWKPTETDKNYIAKVSNIDFIAKFRLVFWDGLWQIYKNCRKCLNHSE